MKKFLSLLLFLPLVALLSSCHDDDGSSIPDVSFYLDVENTVSDGQIYVVQGTDLDVTSLTVTNAEEGKAAIIGNASYYWDYEFLGTTNVAPFGMKVGISNTRPVGKHVLEVQCTVWAVDKEPAQAYLQYTVNVVASQDDVPATDSSSLTQTAKMVQES